MALSINSTFLDVWFIKSKFLVSITFKLQFQPLNCTQFNKLIFQANMVANVCIRIVLALTELAEHLIMVQLTTIENFIIIELTDNYSSEKSINNPIHVDRDR